jgi:hypothetical protein
MTTWMPRLVATSLLVLTACVVHAQTPEEKEPEPAPQSSSAAEQLTKIVEAMRGIETLLKDRETGDETQAAQQNVIDELDKLLNMPPDQSNPSGSGGGGSSNNQSSSNQNGGGQSRNKPGQSSSQQKKPGDPSRMQPKPGAGNRRDRQNADDSEERTGPNRAAVTPAAKRQRLEVDVWGHLPEKLREQLLSSYGEKMLPQYEDAVRRFYDRLANPTSPRSRSSEPPR